MKKKKEKKTKYVYNEFSIRIDDYTKMKLDSISEEFKVSRNEVINCLFNEILVCVKYDLDSRKITSYGNIGEIIKRWESYERSGKCAPKYDEKVKK